MTLSSVIRLILSLERKHIQETLSVQIDAQLKSLPVTQEVTGSSPVRTAEESLPTQETFLYYSSKYDGVIIVDMVNSYKSMVVDVMFTEKLTSTTKTFLYEEAHTHNLSTRLSA